MDVENMKKQIQEAFDKDRAEQEKLIIKQMEVKNERVNA